MAGSLMRPTAITGRCVSLRTGRPNPPGSPGSAGTAARPTPCWDNSPQRRAVQNTPPSQRTGSDGVIPPGQPAGGFLVGRESQQQWKVIPQPFAYGTGPSRLRIGPGVPYCRHRRRCADWLKETKTAPRGTRGPRGFRPHRSDGTCPDGALDKVFDELADVVNVQRPGYCPHHRAGNGRWCDRRVSRVLGVHLPAGMEQLDRRRRTRGLDTGCHLARPGSETGSCIPKGVGIVDRPGRGCGVFHDHHTHTPARPA
ncbi:MAG: hypothetical protein Ct9H300mP16_04810 [Pseudomonadota bacterium]|nr:MAG: hypothetical protein Ct9H300mP16_04810 [Pseudomonadota bacterium]